MPSKETPCQCRCGLNLFKVRLHRDEQVGLITCAAGHHSLLLDSRDYWSDVLQDGRPRQIRCRCKRESFHVALMYDFRDTGQVAAVDVVLTCAECKREALGASFEINYDPTDRLLSHPLDPIQDPWLRAREVQITSYWLATDAECFAAHLTAELGARAFHRVMGECEFLPVKRDLFLPGVHHELYFTNLPDVAPKASREPQKAGPFVRLASPIQMVYGSLASGVVLDLYRIEYAAEIIVAGEKQKQPPAFLAFAKSAIDWLKQNFISERGRNTADNPTEFARWLPYR